MKRVSFGFAIAVYGMSTVPAWGQAIAPDTTLGTSNSTTQETTIRSLPSTLIQGGVTQGANLFHSFLRFNIPEGRGAYFANPTGIRNIFSRVTGGERTEIFGKLGVLGDANLFLMNPNGILFGQTGSLDVGGSFVATTANAIQFGDRGSFDATNPTAPNSVLTVDPSAFLFTQVPTGKIINRSIAPAGTTPAGAPISGLRVPNSKNLLFVGGDIEVDRGILSSVGGRIELSGLAESGAIGIDAGLRLNILGNPVQAHLMLSNGGVVAVVGEGGEIIVNMNRLTATGGSQLLGLLETTGEAANININTNMLELSGYGNLPSGILQTVLPNASGQGGNLSVNAKQIIVLNGAVISSINFGNGQGANLQIKADSIDLIGSVISPNGPSDSALGSETKSEGNAGNVNVSTKTLRIREGADLTTSSQGRGQGGKLQVKADSIEMIGGASEQGTALGSLVYSEGNAGNVTIVTGSLSIRNGAFVANSSYSTGQGGNLQVKADTIEIIGRSPSERFSSFLGSLAFGSGSTRDVSVSTRTLSILNGGALSTSSYGKGQGGNLQVQAKSIELTGVSTNQSIPSVLGSLAYSEGNAGNVNISTETLSIRDGSFLATSSDDIGQGGNLQIKADVIEIIGRTPDEGFGSFLGSIAFEEGNSGNIELVTRELRILNGGSLSTSSLGKGRGGNLKVYADSIELLGISPNRKFGSTLASQARAQGSAGNISITTKLLDIGDSAILSTSTFERGQGGDLQIKADSIQLSRGTIASLSTGQGNSGNIHIEVNGKLNAVDGVITSASDQTTAGSINITADSIRLRGNSDIQTQTFGRDRKGGDITLTTRDYILALEDSDIFAFSAAGRGGNITFNTPAFLSLPRYVPKPNQSFEFLNGNNQVDVNATGAVSGAIAGIPDITFLQNGLTPLAQTAIDTNTLLTNSCIVRNQQNGTFYITGTGGLPTNPGDLSAYPTGSIQSVNSAPTEKQATTIVEPQGVYQLANGQLVLSRECP